MRAPKSVIIALGLMSVLGGCASMPHIQSQYYYPKALTTISIVQTLGCTPDETRLISAISVVPTTTYVADHEAPVSNIGLLDYSDIGGFLTDADVTMNFGDGRTLTGINATTTGQGAAVIKSIVSMASAFATLALEGGVATHSPKEIKDACDQINQLAAKPSAPGGDQPAGGASKPDAGGKPKPGGMIPDAAAAVSTSDKAVPYRPGATVSVTYSAHLAYTSDPDGVVTTMSDPDTISNAPPVGDLQKKLGSLAGGDQPASDIIPFTPDPASATILASLPILQKVVPTVRMSGQALLADGVTWPSDARSKDDHFKAIKLNSVAEVTLEVWGPDTNLSPNPVPIWRGKAAVPVRHYYELPIPKGTPFGKQVIALALNADGSISKLEYTANSGSSDAADAATAIAKALPQRQTQASIDQAKADAIYEHERLIQCETTATCPSK